jgi:anaerobic magnesium-protoporphyrin IX monomethyl ester cyclase
MKVLNIVLICPPPIEVIEPWVDTPPYARNSLAFLAGYLRAHTPFNILIIEAKFEQLSFEETVWRALEFKPDIVGLTAYTQEIKPAAYTAGLIKRKNPNVITVIGGVHVTAIPQQTMQEFPTFDIAVVGEGEITLAELCKAVAQKKGMDEIRGLIYRDKGTLIKTAFRERHADQDSLPMPAWDLMPYAPIYFMHTERGCPFNCTFCMNHNGTIARKRSVHLIIEEMEYIINNFGPPQINFGDELFSVDMERTSQLMDAMIERGLHKKIIWDAQTHVKYVNYDLLLKMKAANIYQLDMGVETGDPDRLREMGKGTNRDMIIKAFEDAKRAGIQTGGLFIFGHPNETNDSIRNTIKLAVKINPTLPMFGTMTPFPGTEVAKLAAEGKAGYVSLSSDWDDYKMRLGSGLTYKHLSKQELNLRMLEAYVKIYLFNFRFLDFARFLWNYRKGAWQLLKKILKREDVLSERIKRPADYEEVINTEYSITCEDMIESRVYFRGVQKSENSRLKKILQEA